MWNGNERRRSRKKSSYSGLNRRSKIEKNYRESSQLYQFEFSVRVLFLPDFNVWQVHKLDYATWKQLRFEIVGYNNSSIAFEFAVLYIKLLKYGLDDDERARISILGYKIDDDEKTSHNPDK